MKKLFILIIAVFLFTGCASGNYKLEINKDLSVIEDANITGTNEFFSIFYKNHPITIVKEFYDSDTIKSKLNDNNYFHELIRDEGNPKVHVNKKFNSIKEYVDGTIFKGNGFEDIEYEINDNLVTVRAKGLISPLNETVEGGYVISSMNISIKSYYDVVDSNADSFNKTSNTYTWNIKNDGKSSKEISLTLNKNKKYYESYLLYILFFIFSVVLCFILYSVSKVIRRARDNNSF